MVNDGERSSTWARKGWSSDNSQTTSHTEWIQFDMGTSYMISKVDLYPRNDGVHVGYGFPVDFTIRVSADCATWSTVVTRTNYPLPSNAGQSFTFAPHAARCVQIEGTNLRPNPNDGGQYRMQLAEVEVY